MNEVHEILKTLAELPNDRFWALTVLVFFFIGYKALSTKTKGKKTEVGKY